MVAGMDFETALRYHLPIVYIVNGNDGWLTDLPPEKESSYER